MPAKGTIGIFLNAWYTELVDAHVKGSIDAARFEFLLQEMGREINTIGSKAADAPISHWVVELKTELEKLREQVLNGE